MIFSDDRFYLKKRTVCIYLLSFKFECTFGNCVMFHTFSLSRLPSVSGLLLLLGTIGQGFKMDQFEMIISLLIFIYLSLLSNITENLRTWLTPYSHICIIKLQT